MLRLPAVGRALSGAAKGSLAPSNTGRLCVFKRICTLVTCVFTWYVDTAAVVATWDDIETSVSMVVSVLTQSRAAGTMVEVFVDGKPVEVEAGTTVLQVKEGNLLLFLWLHNACINV